MPVPERGTDRAGRRAKRFLTPLQKYEIWLQLVRQEVTIAEAATQREVDRSTIMRIRTVAKEGALAALGGVSPGREGRRSGTGSWRRPGRESPDCRRGPQGDGRQADAGRGKRRLGLSGRVPRRVDAATKAALLDLLDDAVAAGWTLRGACRRLELGELRAWRWLGRRAVGAWRIARRAGARCTGCCRDEIAEIVALSHEWGEIDRSHRKLAHRGSYLAGCGCRRPSVRRVLADHGLHLPAAAPARALGAASRSRTGSTTAQPDVDLRHDALHHGRHGRDW